LVVAHHPSGEAAIEQRLSHLFLGGTFRRHDSRVVSQLALDVAQPPFDNATINQSHGQLQARGMPHDSQAID
jgi:hypothetical protein